MVCEEKGVPYEIVPARPHTSEIVAIHPLGKMPAMRHGDVRLFESKAIASYIDAVFDGPKVIPHDTLKAAEVDQWVSLVNTSVDPCMIRSYFFANMFPNTADGKPDRAKIEGAVPELHRLVSILDQAVARTGFLVGSSFTLADINLLPILYYVQHFPEGQASVRSARHLFAYFGTHSLRPSFLATIPPPIPNIQIEAEPEKNHGATGT
jgi:glutathione S-transferase